ncbi:hypothetical protein OG205_01445 [Lentzea sp. NBC_00516]|uniref:hypothetical protein n=1 Tax=Lentzea sp. NBC_00516 TaxID=2903582 RepID=UPI002E8168F1|nr:hypothetical protein [Lentzea sp. NBC_00516]WUD25690.1 hypothetical protein OG205_01445 [Lentzea sp. NBC_00516]
MPACAEHAGPTLHGVGVPDVMARRRILAQAYVVFFGAIRMDDEHVGGVAGREHS